jgi:hypothetical protein
MNLLDFNTSLTQTEPPAGLSPYLTALWHEARGQWDTAHEIVQVLNTSQAAWVHAYLHRQEGDEGNARYWYRTAGKSFPANQTLAAEWQDIVQQLLEQAGGLE